MTSAGFTSLMGHAEDYSVLKLAMHSGRDSVIILAKKVIKPILQLLQRTQRNVRVIAA